MRVACCAAIPRGLSAIHRRTAISHSQWRRFFQSPLYGPHINFRVDAGDLPEFLALSARLRQPQLGVSAAGGSKWLAQAAEVVARYVRDA